MTLQNLDDIVAAQVPLILPDTCILLDILRSPRRDNVDARSVLSAKAIAEAVKLIGSVGSVVASQVCDELSDNRGRVRQETEDGLRKLQIELQRIDGWSGALGVNGQADLSHGLNAVSRCELILVDWVDASLVAPTTDTLTGRAHRRMMQRATPARQGKDSFKDCLVVETYLTLAKELRVKGYTERIVFASSNTAEFIERPGSQLHADIAQEFAVVGIEYARALHEAAYRLGLNTQA
ncbi:hypothetical protein Nwi_2827 [Nitrobacter winogradskyi Nb-255]|uniref:Uncharacterized protein n=1 Tax=Nitrobacter winogradskyi (strain ATCC 25391 / DSM 10237 / CIP 104748 / NCIMB 11846 / Nb-255) TaxID=323098 RepID=Q3SNR1_NITWN|nr:PIN domain-containing protein [Nitrobacter winogradskyi]ABA06080.1 hypothetical protein Nwi_2827 [Nitrobacter winogradskyi Nb-255]